MANSGALYPKEPTTSAETSLSGFGDRAASPQSDRCGLYSSSRRIFDDLKFLCTIGGRHTSCRYSKARAVPSAILTRVFHVSFLLTSSEKCNTSCSVLFPMNSYTRSLCPCSTQ
uniref:Uncharacterized protein n=1 Tax=Arundo donax TaxID=35708 RepID=A0A0A9CJE4_ARUDO